MTRVRTRPKALAAAFVATVLLLAVAGLLMSRAPHADGRAGRARDQARQLAQALARMQRDTQWTDGLHLSLSNLAAPRWPPPGEGPFAGDLSLPPCALAGDGVPCWGGPYLAATPDLADPWGAPWRVSFEATSRKVAVRSLGADPKASADDVTQSAP